MGKKRKAGGRPFGQEGPDKTLEADNKLHINTYEDVADSEDEFHINRDKLLLEEGPVQKRRRRAQEDEDFLDLSDEEVLAESSEATDVDDVDDEEEAIHVHVKPRRAATGRENSDSEASALSENGEEVGGWGTSKQDYYNADAIETEADALAEEVEARRLQQKQLQGLTDADFGFDEVDWLAVGKGEGEDDEDNGQENVVREILPRLEITDAMGPEERLKLLRSQYPEFEPLAKEFLDLQDTHEDLQLVAAAATTIQLRKKAHLKGNSITDPEEEFTPVAVLQHSTLSAYLGTLSMYFALLTSGTADLNGKMSAMPPAELREHTVMETLMQCRDLWEKVKDIAIPDTSRSGMGSMEEMTGHTVSEKDLDLTDSKKVTESTTETKTRRKKPRKTKAQRAADVAQAEADNRRKERLRRVEEDLAGLSALTAHRKQFSKPSDTVPTTTIPDEADSDFGEQTVLTPHEALEKAKRKKSLRFYTSQIAQKSNKRDAAGRDAGGDADLPYRERFRDRQIRLNADAESRGEKKKGSSNGAPLDDGSGDEADHRTAREMRDGPTNDENEYYDLISSRSSAKKSSKAALAAATALAAKEGGVVRIVEDAEVGKDGKRAITYAIEKNKGLAPRRKKEVRNPRVKKRMKYEQKKKKLGSTRAVWAGGEGRGGYGGEKTGIKAGLIRSVKL